MEQIEVFTLKTHHGARVVFCSERCSGAAAEFQLANQPLGSWLDVDVEKIRPTVRTCIYCAWCGERVYTPHLTVCWIHPEGCDMEPVMNGITLYETAERAKYIEFYRSHNLLPPNDEPPM